MIDGDDLAEALCAGAGAGVERTATRQQVVAFTHRVRRFLAELPGDLSIHELSEAFEAGEDDDEEDR